MLCTCTTISNAYDDIVSLHLETCHVTSQVQCDLQLVNAVAAQTQQQANEQLAAQQQQQQQQHQQQQQQQQAMATQLSQQQLQQVWVFATMCRYT
jgi:sorbitol-specific phosphotransferase system component IIBC